MLCVPSRRKNEHHGDNLERFSRHQPKTRPIFHSIQKPLDIEPFYLSIKDTCHGYPRKRKEQLD